jgi:hypothetical protein
MSYPGFKTYEDPFYDDDGVLIDEDANWEDIKEEVKQDIPEACYVMDCDPFSTINS